MHLVGFIIKKFVTMQGHTNVNNKGRVLASAAQYCDRSQGSPVFTSKTNKQKKMSMQQRWNDAEIGNWEFSEKTLPKRNFAHSTRGLIRDRTYFLAVRECYPRVAQS
jgi:hypothetical protein